MMSIQSLWKEKYKVLTDYTEANPEIYIDVSEVSIPKHLRDTFYLHFDTVRDTLVEDYCKSLPVAADTLSENYCQSEKELVELLELERIDVPMDLSSFLHNPKQGLVRVLYNRLFELMQGKITMGEFEKLADADLNATTANFCCLGYESWAALALIRSLEPDRFIGVELDQDYKPCTGESKEIAFGRQFHHVAKRIPEFILHSQKFNKNMAVKMPLAREVESYYIPFEPPVKPKKRTGDTSYALDSRVLFLSVVADLTDIPVFADIHTRKVNGPDLMVEFMLEQELADEDALAGVKKRTEIMKPKFGTCIVVMDPEQDAEIEKPAENIEAFAVGFDQLKLQPIIDKFA
jgi:hypothetical protein